MLYFLAWHHIIDSVPRVLSCGLYAIYNISTFCLLRFIYYHHKDEHVVPAAFKYVNFFFFFFFVSLFVFLSMFSLASRVCRLLHAIFSGFPFYVDILFFFSYSFVDSLFLLLFVNLLAQWQFCAIFRCSAYVIFKANSVIVWWNEKRKEHKSTNKRKLL